MAGPFLSPPQALSGKTHAFPLVISKPVPEPDALALFQKLASPSSFSFLLESGKTGTKISRYSILGSEPFLVLSGKGRQVQIQRGDRIIAQTGNPLSVLASLLDPPWIPHRPDISPFLGGAVGFLGYDLVRQFERIPERAIDDLGLPDFTFLFVDVFVVIDHWTQTVHLVYSPSPERLLSQEHDALLREGRARLHALAEKLEQDSSLPTDKIRALTLADIVPQQSQSDYARRVVACKEFIAAGDIYQANLSHRFDLHLHRDTGLDSVEARCALYQRLRCVNPSPFSALLNLGDFSLVSSSPERLVALQGDRVETRPIAGTRPRGKTSLDDRRNVETLLTNPKERAEHLMLVDLARNDLGRVCAYGSIHVDEFMIVERYSHVAHLVSNVTGTLHPSRTRADLLRSVFPGGTITGVPKIRCMEIIEELEPVRRGPYTGSIGYWSWNGNLDFNLIIRTILLTRHQGYLQVGAGIVADSEPAREYEETLHKAQALLQALTQDS